MVQAAALWCHNSWSGHCVSCPGDFLILNYPSDWISLLPSTQHLDFLIRFIPSLCSNLRHLLYAKLLIWLWFPSLPQLPTPPNLSPSHLTADFICSLLTALVLIDSASTPSQSTPKAQAITIPTFHSSPLYDLD